jgi:tRNA A-37 threonylcarbamoyl transferase component Bud32
LTTKSADGFVPFNIIVKNGGPMIGIDALNWDSGRMQVQRRFAPLLEANGLTTMARIMGYAGGQMMRSVPGRSTLRIELAQPGKEPQVAYLKRYEPGYLSFKTRLLRRLRCTVADEALHEWTMIHRLKQHGFQAPEPIATGQVRTEGWNPIVTHSFVLTAHIAQGIAAHEHLKQLSAQPRCAFMSRVGQLTGRFHQAGFIHKDYYLSHVWVAPSQAENSGLYLIDLQRLIGPGRFSPRWRVKDLAALVYSARLAGAAPPDLEGFYRHYFHVASLGSLEQRWIQRVDRRVQALNRRQPKYDVIWDQPGIRPPNV